MGPKGKEKKAAGDEKNAKKAEVAVSAKDDNGKVALTVADIKQLEQEVRSTRHLRLHMRQHIALHNQGS